MGGRQGVIKNTKSKLLFTLMYVKVYPTYDLAGALFGVVASRPHEWVNEYLPILEEALARIFHEAALNQKFKCEFNI